jgi:hypothetical protein
LKQRLLGVVAPELAWLLQQQKENMCHMVSKVAAFVYKIRPLFLELARMQDTLP